LSSFRVYRRCRTAGYRRPFQPAAWLRLRVERRPLARRFERFQRSKPTRLPVLENTMLKIYHDESRPSRVTVAFEDSALSFMLSKDATFEDLADRLDRLERQHSKPIAIEVKFAAASDARQRRMRI